MLAKFLAHCTSASKWDVANFTHHIEEEVRKSVGNRKVFILVSGGVDSTVAYALLQRVLGNDRVYGLVVDTGFMRKNEIADTQTALAKIGFANLHVENASELFFSSLREVYEPEAKRKLIGQMFLDVKDKVAKQLECHSAEWVLGQGTIYPDTVETGGTKHSSKIKTHHNRVDAITQLIAEGRIVEPLKELYKDEVRALGKALHLPDALIYRHPFPGPGLAVRILCASHAAPPPPAAATLLDEIRKFCGPHFDTAILPVLSVGVQGDNRSYKHAVALYVPSYDVFIGTDDVSDRKHIELELWRLANQLPNHFNSINRVLVCLSHRKPPQQFVFAQHSYLTRERTHALADADAVVESHMRRLKLYDNIWQFPVVLLPFGSSAGRESIVLRPVDSQDAMSASAYALPVEFVSGVRRDLLALPTIDTVFYDLTSKPPGTIEWE